MKYSIGLDIGTNSCGVAVIDEDFSLLKSKNKNIWGAIKFDEGQTAQERRRYRGSRRLITRKKWRLRLFRKMIEEEILKNDPTFFHRLEDSYKHFDDKRELNCKYNLFIDKEFNDKNYFEKYPTIYHLRYSLVKNDIKHDIRLVYLAIYHILKYRGNFINEGQSFDIITSSSEKLISDLFDYCADNLEININLDIKSVLKILEDNNKSKKDKVTEIISLDKFTKETKALVKEIFSGILGLQMNLSKIFTKVDLNDLEKIKLSEGTIDDKLSSLSDILGDDFFIIQKIKEVYSELKLREILGDDKYISQAMIKKYDKFSNDLKILKKVIKENCPIKTYNEIFRSNDNNTPNYNNYINLKIKKDNVIDNRKLFYDNIRKILNRINSEEANYIIKEMDEESFLIKLNTTDNAIIPNQLHEIELKQILDNQGKYYKVLRENKDKILSILTFRIPYYVGPLCESSKFSWLEKNIGQENSQILPWNLKDVVNIDITAEKFIDRMTNYCTYLQDEKVIPFNSIIYTEYLYYNEINKIEFNGRNLDKEHKDKLKEDIFMKYSNVTEKILKNWYAHEFGMSAENIEVSKLQGDRKANVTLRSIRDFKKIYGKITKDNIWEIEKIIYWLTVYSDKEIIKRRIKNELNIPKERLTEILKLNYEGWGKFSNKLLIKIKVEDGRYKGKTILDILHDTNLNFMQIINNDSFRFNKIIENINGSDIIDKIKFDAHIKQLQGSPALKKGIWQAVKQVEEVIKITGEVPMNIYIEFAREEQESRRILARRENLISLYENFDYLNDDDNKILKELKNRKIKIDTERMYLYYTQRGKCMYTQETLDIDTLQEYEIDHIIPRSIIKDDSLSNKVLVKKKLNQMKSSATLRKDIIDKNVVWWNELLKYKLISKKKYDNLANRSGDFNQWLEKDFINRQLVEVRQISKHVTNLFKRAYGYKGTNVIAIKSSLVSDFKDQYKIYKNRAINDFHHAKDAYIVAVIGQYIMKRYPSLKSEFIYDDYLKWYKREATDKDKFGFIISSMNHNYRDDCNNKIIWNAKEKIGKILKVINYNDCIITRKTEIITGSMFNLTRLPKADINKLTGNEIPLKNNKSLYLPPEKYGYYNGVQESYYALIEFNLKNKRVKRIVGIPVMVAANINGSKDELKKYLSSKYKDVKVIKEKIPKYQKIRYEGHEYYIVSSNEWCNAKQLILKKNIYDNISKLNDKLEFNKMSEEEKDKILIESYNCILDKLVKNYGIYKGIIKKLSDNIDTFKALSSINKLKVINEILNITRANSQCANLKLVYGVERVGRISGKDTIDANKITFIYESQLGINRREVKY